MNCGEVSIWNPWTSPFGSASSSRSASEIKDDTWVEFQLLVKLSNRTHVVSFQVLLAPDHLLLLPTSDEVASALSNKTGIPASLLVVQNLPLAEMYMSLQQIHPSSCDGCRIFFVNASMKSFLRGGKGGFGSLLKGQSKKAAAKTTLDFGACRDLTGRRLRHINDEIKLRKWHQAQALQQQGITINEEEHYQTKSGIDNWFLDIPNWAMEAFSDKSRKRNERRIQRSIQRQQHDQQQRQHYQQEIQQARERQIMEYVALADIANPPSMDEAIAQGMKRRRQRIGLPSEEMKNEDHDSAIKKPKMDNSTEFMNDLEDDPTFTGWFCSLSGDMQTEDQPTTTTTTATHEVSIQATSEFSTGVVLLPNSYSVSNGGLVRGQWYYEVILTTGHIAQIGWASKEFSPDSSAGNGVGDDAYSYGYDGSRGLLFHGSNNETTAVPLRWKPKDIVGCLFDADNGIISYTLNGSPILGATFSIPKHERRGLFPAVSLNLDEIVKVRISNLSYLPKGYKEISNVITESSMESVDTYPEPPLCIDTSNNEIPKSESSPTSAEAIVVASEESAKEIILPSLDTIESFNSVEEVMELGLETLKSYLMSIGIKCGGTLRERAARLFSLKGLQRDQYPEKLRAKNFIP